MVKGCSIRMFSLLIMIRKNMRGLTLDVRIWLDFRSQNLTYIDVRLWRLQRLDFDV